jgi:hypothetical protein
VRRERRGPGGKTTSHVLPREEWTVLITDAHPGYLTWPEFEANQTRLTELATAHGTDRKASPPREGSALLQGVVSCGKCGRRMTVRYQHYKGTGKPIYLCQFDGIRNAVPICQTMVGDQIDAAVGELLLATLTPLTLEVALRVSDELAARAEEADRLRAAFIERARYRADLARRRYLAVDPANRLVAATLEADWNDALRELAQATDEYERAKNTALGPLSPEARARITALAADFPRLWNDPATPMRERKRMLRFLVTDVTLTKTDHITVGVVLRGGQSHQLTLPRPQTAWELRQTDPAVVAALDELLNEHTDAQSADILNERGLPSGMGRPFTRGMIVHLRNAYQLRSHRQRLLDAGMLTVSELARHLGVHFQTVKHWRRDGIITGVLANDKGAYVYPLPGPELVRPVIGRPRRKRPGPRTLRNDPMRCSVMTDVSRWAGRRPGRRCRSRNARRSDRFGVQRHRLAGRDMTADHGLGPDVDDRRRDTAEMLERPSVAGEERPEILAGGEAAERITGVRQRHVEGIDLLDALLS